MNFTFILVKAQWVSLWGCFKFSISRVSYVCFAQISGGVLIFFFHLGWIPPPWSFVWVSAVFFVWEKPVLFLAPESSGFIKKRSCSVQGLELQEASLACAAVLCRCVWAAVSPSRSSVQGLLACCRRCSVPDLVLRRRGLVCLWLETRHYFHHIWSPAEL